MLEEGVRQEIAWGSYVIGDEIPGLNSRMVTDYIRYLGNLRWSGLGYGYLYEDNREEPGQYGVGEPVFQREYGENRFF